MYICIFTIITNNYNNNLISWGTEIYDIVNITHLLYTYIKAYFIILPYIPCIYHSTAVYII